MIDKDLYEYLTSRGFSKETIDSNSDKINNILKSIDPKTSKKSLYSKIEKYISRPDVFTQAYNLLNSSISHLRDGVRKAEDGIVSSRMNTCEACEYFDSSSKRCNHCGCFLEIKTTWASERCPIGKWEAVGSEAAAPPSEDCGCPGKTVYK